MARRYDGQVTFIGVAGHDTVGRMQEFVERHDVGHFPHAATEDGSLWARWEVAYQPAFVLIDPEGEIVFKEVRPDLADLEAELEALAT